MCLHKFDANYANHIQSRERTSPSRVSLAHARAPLDDRNASETRQHGTFPVYSLGLGGSGCLISLLPLNTLLISEYKNLGQTQRTGGGNSREVEEHRQNKACISHFSEVVDGVRDWLCLDMVGWNGMNEY
jgi:hypothetical protein